MLLCRWAPFLAPDICVLGDFLEELCQDLLEPLGTGTLGLEESGEINLLRPAPHPKHSCTYLLFSKSCPPPLFLVSYPTSDAYAIPIGSAVTLVPFSLTAVAPSQTANPIRWDSKNCLLSCVFPNQSCLPIVNPSQ